MEEQFADFECNLVSFSTKNYYPKREQDVEHIFPFTLGDKNGERVISLEHTYKIHQSLNVVLEYKSKAEINTHFISGQNISPTEVASIIEGILQASKQIFENVSQEQVKQKFTFVIPTIQQITEKVKESIIGMN